MRQRQNLPRLKSPDQARSGLLTGLLLVTASVVTAAEPPRARPPVFTDEDRAVFFDDAFERLVGPRPDYDAEPSTATAGVPSAPSEETTGTAANWSAYVDAATLETEIKRQSQRLTKATASPAGYRAGGYRQASDALAVVAVMMAVTAEHDGQPRWRDSAAGLRDLFAAAAVEADGKTDAAHKAAAARAADLQDLVRGGRPTTPEPQASVDWGELADRGGVMRRMASAEEERLRGWVVSRREFRRNAEDVRHEAQVLALLAEAILRPGAYDAEDREYRHYAHQLRDAAGRLAEAAAQEDLEAAQRALPELSRSCVECHGDYRG